jgi:uncharacterized repeat protein (TIGR03803 family)
MKNTLQHRNWISRMCLGAASAAPALAAVLALAVITTQPAQAQSFQPLLSFDASNGANPYNMSLVQGLDGNLYGTTFAGGANGLGTVFKVTPTLPATLTTLHSFAGTLVTPADGANPAAGLVLGTDGNFYGTTTEGGANCATYGCGTVFSMTPEGVVTILYSFCQEVSNGNCDDGGGPEGPVIQAFDGNFYGTTLYGGLACIATGCTGGTVFRIPLGGGTLKTLFSLGPATGEEPEAALLQAIDGEFYGTASGTIFGFPFGGPLIPLYNVNATGPLVQAGNGNFYGTVAGALPNNGGAGSMVYSFAAGGPLTPLYSFCSQKSCPDGADPYAGLIQDANGNFYGTTDLGGTNDGGTGNNGLCLEDGELLDGCGTIFEIRANDGTLKTLHSFDGKDGFNGTDGSLPLAGNGLVQATNGIFYGTTFSGGANRVGLGDLRAGTVFSLSLGLAPFVKAVPNFGPVGATITLLGTNLTSPITVTFNGTPATTFTLVSSSEITATVPAGATSGTVEVTTPSSTLPLSSNVKFRVLP